MDQAEERHATTRPAEVAAQPFAGATAERQANVLPCGAQRDRVAGVRCHQQRRLLGERAAAAASIRTTETADAPGDRDRATPERLVPEVPFVAAVHMAGRSVTGGTRRRAGGAVNEEGDGLGLEDHALDGQATEVLDQAAQLHGRDASTHVPLRDLHATRARALSQSDTTDWLVNLSALQRTLDARPVRSELTSLLVGLDREYAREKQAVPWEEFYADRLIQHFAGNS